MGNAEVDNTWYEKGKGALIEQLEKHKNQLANLEHRCIEIDNTIDMFREGYDVALVDDDEIKDAPVEVQMDILSDEKNRDKKQIQGLYKDIDKDNLIIKRYDNLMEKTKEYEDYDEYKTLTKYSIKQVSEKDVVDRLEREIDAKKIAHRLQNKKVRRVGVFGRWGSGKSTFLNLIKKDIERIDKTKCIHMIDIDASEYSDQTQIWANIYERIKDEYKKDNKYGIKLAKERFKKNKIKNIFNLVIFVALVAIMAICSYLDTAVFDSVDNVKDVLPEWISKSAGTIAMVVFIFKFVLPLSYAAVPEVKKIMDYVGKVFELPTMKETLKEKETVKKNLELLFSAWGNKEIILFVDELDRSNKSTIRSFFQAVQLFDKMENLRIVYAVDQEILKKALKEKDGDEEYITAENVLTFTEKYVDMSIFLDGQIGLKEFVKNLIFENQLLSPREKDRFYRAISHCDNINARSCIKLYNIISQSKDDWIKNFKYFKKDIEKYYEFEDYVYWATLRVMGENLEAIKQVAKRKVDAFESVKMLRDIFNVKGNSIDVTATENVEDLELTDKYEMNHLIIHDISLFEQQLEKYYA